MGRMNGYTKLTGLLGHPVAHSISPLMHNEAFKITNKNYAYLCFDAKEEELEQKVEALKQLGARGWNCTMPDKIRMYELCDFLSPAAELIGAVNTVVNEEGKLYGYNTDGVGYMMSVQEAGFQIIGKKMTLIGAGGAAMAILVQAALDGVKEVSLFCRHGKSWNHAKEMTQRLNKETNCKVRLFDLANKELLKKEISESAILTNATNVGMAPNEDQSIIEDPTMFHAQLVVSDVIYNPRETKLMKLAKEAGCPTFNGLYMLLYQGAEAFRLWTGTDMPVAHIKEKYFRENE